MSIPRTPPAPTLTRQAATTETDELTESQVEFMEDLRASLLDMKHGSVQPALEALREIELEIELEERESRPLE